MASEWTEHRLEDCMAAIIDYRGKTPQKTSSGVPLITAKVVKGGRIERPGEFIAEEDYEAWMRRGMPKPSDVVITTEAPLGEVAQLGTERVALAQRLIALRGRQGVLDNTFLKFLMQSPSVQEQLKARSSGTTVLGIRQSELRKVLLRIPPMAEQKAIAAILGTLDDKIELNRRINETLEGVARVLFKSWFVDFTPVRAKAESKGTGLPDSIAALFPDTFDESEAGIIPHGWSFAPMGAHFDAQKGVSYKGEGLRDSGIPLHNLNSVFEGGGYKYEGIKYYDGEYKSRHITRPGDVIIANTEQGHDRLLIGYAAIVPKSFDKLSIFSHHIFRLRPKFDSPLTGQYLCHLLNSKQMHDVVSGFANGTTVNMLPLDGVQQPLIPVPPRSLVTRFTELADAISDRTDLTERANSTLGALRDVLLLKLISGELRVPDVDGIVGAELK